VVKMGKSKVLWAYALMDFLFVAMGVIMLSFCIIVPKQDKHMPTAGDQAVRQMLFEGFPFTAGIVNSVLIFVTFFITILGVATPQRRWLIVVTYMTTICGVFSLVIGLVLWGQTLQTKEDLEPMYLGLSSQVQDLIQTSFSCCGYLNSTSPAFVLDTTCPSPASAALLPGCALKVASFANVFVGDIFTAVFGICGIDVAFVLATACLLKDRKEKERANDILWRRDELGGKGTPF
jgi:hypothetical protein